MDLGLPWSPTASVEWRGTCINDSYMMRVASSENLTASPGQIMRHAMLLYMSSQNKQGSPFIQDQILSTPLVKEPIRPISTNINRRKQSETPIDLSPAKRVRHNRRSFHNCNDNQYSQFKNLVICYDSDISNSDWEPVSHEFFCC